MSAAIGGEFEAMGLIERDLLISQGLQPDGFVIDVGCGSGPVLKPTGKIVFSFLEFRIPSYWAVFRSNLADLGTAGHLNQFNERNAIEVWAQHLGMRVLELSDGDTPTIPLSQPVSLEGVSTTRSSARWDSQSRSSATEGY